MKSRNTLPCALEIAEECDTETALECVRAVKNELSGISDNQRKAMRECLCIKLLSGSIGAPRGALQS